MMLQKLVAKIDFILESVPIFLLSTSLASNVGMVVGIGEVVEHWKQNTLCLLNYLIIILINISTIFRKAVVWKSRLFSGDIQQRHSGSGKGCSVLLVLQLRSVEP